MERKIIRGLILPAGTEIHADSGLYRLGTRQGPLPEAEATPGRPSPAAVSAGRLAAHASVGDYAQAPVDILIGRSGHPDQAGGAAAWWRDEDGVVYGWEAPSTLTRWRLASTAKHERPTLLARSSGGYLVAGTYNDGAGGLTLRITTLLANGAAATGSPVNYYDQQAATDRTMVYCPCLIRVGERIWLYFVGEESSSRWSIRSLYSDDDGETWNLGATQIDGRRYASVSYLPTRISAALGNDQVMLALGYLAGATEGIAQFVSYDSGATYRLCAGLDATTAPLMGGAPALAFVGGWFVLVYLLHASAYPYRVRLSSAEQPLAYLATSQIEAAGPKWGTLTGLVFDDADVVLVASEDGALYLTARLADGDDEWVVYQSRDLGETFSSMGSSGLSSGAGKWWDGETNGSAPVDAAGCWAGDALCLVARRSAIVGTSGGLHWARLGGWSNITMSPLRSAPTEGDQATWNRTWLPIDPPATQGWARTVFGTTTETLSGQGLRLQVNSGFSGVHYDLTPSGTDRLIAEGACDPTTGDLLFEVLLDDGASGYGVRVLIGASTLEAQDLFGTTLGTVAVSSAFGLRWRLHLRGARATLWWRGELSEVWEAVCERGVLTNGGTTLGTNRVRWGAEGGSSAVDGIWTWLAFSVGESVAGRVPLADPPLRAGIDGDEIVTRESLLPRALSASPIHVADGLAVSLQGGPVLIGESWSITTDSPYASRYALPAVAPSPRDVARWAGSIGSADELHVVVTLDPALAAPGALMGVYLDGLYGGPWDIDVLDPDGGGVWSNVARVDPISFAASVVTAGDGVWLRPTSNAGRSVRLDELVGCAVELWDATKTTRLDVGVVASNSEGHIGLAGRTARISLAGGASAAGSGRQVDIHPRRAICIVSSATISATRPIERIRLRRSLDSGAMYGDILGEIGVIAAGPVAVFGKDYSLTRSLDHQPSVTITTQRDGRRIARQDAPVRRVAELSWVEGVDLSDIRRAHESSAHTSDVVEWASTAVAQRHDVALLLADLLMQRQSGLVVYLPYVPGDEGPVWAVSADRGRGAIYGRIAGSVRHEQAVGEEEVTDLVRVQTVSVEEEL